MSHPDADSKHTHLSSVQLAATARKVEEVVERQVALEEQVKRIEHALGIKSDVSTKPMTAPSLDSCGACVSEIYTLSHRVTELEAKVHALADKVIRSNSKSDQTQSRIDFDEVDGDGHQVESATVMFSAEGDVESGDEDGWGHDEDEVKYDESTHGDDSEEEDLNGNEFVMAAAHTQPSHDDGSTFDANTVSQRAMFSPDEDDRRKAFVDVHVTQFEQDLHEKNKRKGTYQPRSY